MRTVYTAICERVGKWWEITVPELKSGGVTQAKRLDQVDETVRSLVSLMNDVPEESVDVHREVHLPERVRGELDEANQLWESAARNRSEAARLTRDAARVLYESGLPYRDVGVALGVSFQRAKQLVDEGKNLVDA